MFVFYSRLEIVWNFYLSLRIFASSLQNLLFLEVLYAEESLTNCLLL